MTDNTAFPPTTERLRERATASLDRIGAAVPVGTDLSVRSPITGEGAVALADRQTRLIPDWLGGRSLG